MAVLPAGALALLHFDGANGSTTITNAVSGGLTYTASGVAALTTANAKFGSAGLNLSTGVGNIQPGSTVNFPGDFAIIGWAARTGYTGKLFCIGNEGASGSMNLDQYVNNLNLNGASGALVASTSAPFGQPGDGYRMWIVRRTGTTLSLGVQDSGGTVQLIGSVTDSTTFTGKVMFGDKYLSGGAPEGQTSNFWLDEAVVIANAVYPTIPFAAETAAYTLPSAGTAYDLIVTPAAYTIAAPNVRTNLAALLKQTPAAYAITAPNVRTNLAVLLQQTPAAYTVATGAVSVNLAALLKQTPAAYSIAAPNVAMQLAASWVQTPASYTLSAPGARMSLAALWAQTPAVYTFTASDVTMDVTTGPPPANVYDLIVTPAAYTVAFAPVTAALAVVLKQTPAAYSIAAQPVRVQLAAEWRQTPAAYAVAGAPVRMQLAASWRQTPAAYTVAAAPVTVSRAVGWSTVPAAYVFAFAPVTSNLPFTWAVVPGAYSFQFAPVTLTVTNAVLPFVQRNVVDVPRQRRTVSVQAGTPEWSMFRDNTEPSCWTADMTACPCPENYPLDPLRVGDIDTFGFRWNAPPLPWLAPGDSVSGAVWVVDTPMVLDKLSESLQPVGSTLVRLLAKAAGFGSVTVTMTTTLGAIKHATLVFEVTP